MALTLSDLAFILTTALGLASVSLYLLARHFAEKDAAESHVKGCRSLGLVGRSNMDDQYATQNVGTTSASKCEVKALFIYPIKSCGRIELSRSDVVATGLYYDRQFCFAQLLSEQAEKSDGDLGVNMEWTHKWKFVTQRRFPRLSQIHTEVWIPDVSAPDYSPGSEWVKSKGCLVCKFVFTPDWEWNGLFRMETVRTLGAIVKAKLAARSFTAEPMVTFRLPIAPDGARASRYGREIMHIWKDSPEAINVTTEIPQATLAKLKYFLGVSNPLALFMADPFKRRDIFRNAPTRDEAGYQPGTGFADAYPLSILGLESVQDVAGKLSSKRLDALRFRANIYSKLRNTTFHSLATSLLLRQNAALSRRWCGSRENPAQACVHMIDNCPATLEICQGDTLWNRTAGFEQFLIQVA